MTADRRSCARFAAAACLLLAVLATASGAAAQGTADPAQVGITVVPPAGQSCPPPTGSVNVSVEGLPPVTVPLRQLAATGSAITPIVASNLQALGRDVQISYSGDTNYEPLDPQTVALSPYTTLTLVLRCRDTAPPPPRPAAIPPPPPPPRSPRAPRAPPRVPPSPIPGPHPAAPPPPAAAPHREPAVEVVVDLAPPRNGRPPRSRPLTPSSLPATPPLTSHSGSRRRNDQEKIVGVLIAIFVLLAVLTDPRRRQRPADYEPAEPEFLAAGFGVTGRGDRSHTWTWPGTARLDGLSRSLPVRLVRRSPLLARVLADGAYMRAILGSTSIVGPLVGLGLGLVAVEHVNGDALPPGTALTIAIAALGVLDAAAGLAAVTTFVIGVAALGGVTSNDDVRLLGGLAALWFIVPIAAGAVRPLRRRATRTAGQVWDRAADVLIGSLVGGWAAKNIVEALPLLAPSRDLAIDADASKVAIWVIGALIVRFGFETMAAHLYPRRLDTSDAPAMPEPGPFQRLWVGALRTVIFVFVVNVAMGSSWQLWVAAALFALPAVLSAFEQWLPRTRAFAWTATPGLRKTVLTLIVCVIFVALLDEHSSSFKNDAVVVLALAGAVLSVLSLLARSDARSPRIGWGSRISGIAVLAVGIVLALTQT